MKFCRIVISVSAGTAAGGIPVVGCNIGAKRLEWAKSLFAYLLTAEAVVGSVALLFVEIFPPAAASKKGEQIPGNGIKNRKVPKS